MLQVTSRIFDHIWISEHAICEKKEQSLIIIIIIIKIIIIIILSKLVGKKKKSKKKNKNTWENQILSSFVSGSGSGVG